MAVEQYSLVAHDWLNLEFIINDLASRVIGQSLGTGSSPTFAGVTVTGLTASGLVATDASKALESVTVGSSLSYSRPTLNTIQGIRTVDSPTFAGGTFTGVVTGVTPTAGTHLATKEYVDLALGTRNTFFLSDTASGVGSLNYAYPHETTEAESTIISAALGIGDAQLVQGWITEAGEPNTTLVNAGVILFDIHAKKGAANQRATQLYAVLSYVDADGTSNKIPITTSAITAELSDVEGIYHIHGALAEGVEIEITDRIILDVYANIGDGAQDAVITLYLEGNHNSHFSFEISGGIWQNWGDILDDLNTLGVVASDGQMIVGTGAGAFAYESGATLRTSIGVDVAGTAAGLVGTHESTYNHGQYNTAYSHSQLASGNPHSVTPTELSLLIGTNTQAWDAGLDSLAGLTYASDSFIKVTAENTYVIRTIAETKSDLSLNLVENTALSTWVGTTNITTLGTIATGVWEATDIAIAHGGTGQSTAQTAIDALTAVSGATNEHVLTKDTATGNAIFKAAAPQIVSRGDPVPYDFTMKKETGSATSTSANHLVDTAATFETNNIAIGDWVYNTTDLTWAAVTAINSEIDLTLGTDIMVNGETYEVGTFKMNNVYHELDLSSIVPAGATYIHVRCVFYDDIVGTNFLLQSNDYSNGRNIFSYNNFAVNTWYSISDFIQCDSNRKIKYSASSPWTYMNLVVRGWILG